MKLALGTVQFGLPYGITNTAGQVSEDEVVRILRRARELGLAVLDTAAAYGQSESVLGRCAGEAHAFRLYTKTLPLGGAAADATAVRRVVQGVHDSLRNLGVGRLDGLLVHHAGDLLGEGGQELYAALHALKAQGLVERLGVSVYSVEEARAATQHFGIDAVQLPLNVLDQSFTGSGELQRLKAAGVEIHTRSAFLQGILLSQQLPAFLHALAPGFGRFQAICREAGASQLEGSLAFLRQQGAIDHVVVGVLDQGQLEQIASAWERSAACLSLDFAECNMAPSAAVTPSNWPALKKEHP
ncbi:aldo/keto reductase [Cupriavidus sp. 30B13]|uniref:aldo/keto reductase n=1 Tax=Cupriavidus sp. 30B13 TaxID=3384241 RepID=UPI003B9194DC